MRRLFNLVFLSVCVLSSAESAFAKTLWCNYSDFFHLSNDSPVTLRILSLQGDNNITVQQKDAVSFYLKDVPSCPPEGGTAKVAYGIDSQHFCELTIHDGESDYHPQMTASCHGLAFAGMTYDGFGSYRYSIHIAQ